MSAAVDPGPDFRALAVTLAADRLGVTRPVANCLTCGCALYARDIFDAGDAIPCAPDCTARIQLEELYP